MKTIFYNQGQTLTGIIIVLVIVGVITGGLYLYLSNQIPEVPELAEKPGEEEIVSEEKAVELEREKEGEIVSLPKEELPEKETTALEETPEEEVTPTCQNECSQTGSKKCLGNGYQTCGNYDADNCLEWSSVIVCAANTICQNGSCVEKPKPFIEGIVLVRKNSNLSSFAKKLSEERKWYLLEVNSSNPKTIRQDIITITNKNNVDYLLIFGDHPEIPISDYPILEDFLSEMGFSSEEMGIPKRWYKEGVPSNSLYRNILDNLYYGNIDKDPFVELSVGRLPFSNTADIENYFSNVSLKKDINYVSILRYEKTLGAISIPEIRQQFINFKVDNILSVTNKNEVTEYLKQSDLFIFHTHGTPVAFTIKPTDYTSLDIPDLHKNKPIFISGACMTGQQIGKDIVKKGATAFIGYYTEAGQANSFPIRPSKPGESIGESIKNVINKDIALQKFYKKRAFPTAFYLIGDPSIIINYEELNNYPKLSISESKEKIVVNIPGYSYERSDEIQKGVYDIYLFFDGWSRSFYEDPYEHIKKGRFFSSHIEGYDPHGINYHVLVECDPEKEVSGWPRCWNVQNWLQSEPGYAQHNIKIPFEYAVIYSDYHGYTPLITQISRNYNIKNFYRKIDNINYQLHSNSIIQIISGDNEHYLIFYESLNDYFKSIESGDIYKSSKIIIETEKAE